MYVLDVGRPGCIYVFRFFEIHRRYDYYPCRSNENRLCPSATDNQRADCQLFLLFFLRVALRAEST